MIDASKKYNEKEVLCLDELNFDEGYVYALMGLNGSYNVSYLKKNLGDKPMAIIKGY